MIKYSYKAKSDKKELVKGIIEAIDKNNAINIIEKMGYTPINIIEYIPLDKSNKTKKKLLNFQTGFKLKPKMKLQYLLLFSREISDLVASGMTIGQALNTLSRRKDKKNIKTIIQTLRNEIINGSSFSDALNLFPETFSSLYINLVKAGEASGNLSLSLENICVHYERVSETQSKVKAAMTYPTIVMIIGLLAVIGMMIYIVPQFEGTFAEMGASLPTPTQILMNISEFTSKYGIIFISFFTALIIMFKGIVKRNNNIKKIWHSYQLKIPILGKIIKTNSFTHFSRTLGTLLQNGVSILPALKIVQLTINNVVISSEIELAKEKITDGSTISKPLSKGNIFPPIFIDMLSIGEETGDMPSALKHITRRYDNELDRLVKTCTTVLEPLLIVLVALIIGSMAICLLLPVLSLTETIGL